MPLPPDYLTGRPVETINMDEQERWNYIEAELESAEKKVQELEARNNNLMIACNFAIGAISVVLVTMHNVTPTKRTLTETINKLEDALNK